MERNAKHVACWFNNRPVIVTDRDFRTLLYFDDIIEANAACALLNLGFEWSGSFVPSSKMLARPVTVQPLILSPAPKER